MKIFIMVVVFFIGLLSTTVAQDSVYCQRILLTYSEWMDNDIADISNYTVFDDSLNVP